MNQSALEALYGQFRALRSETARKGLERVEAERNIERIKADITRINEQSQELLDFAAANGADLEAIHNERIAMNNMREYDPMGAW